MSDLDDLANANAMRGLQSTRHIQRASPVHQPAAYQPINEPTVEIPVGDLERLAMASQPPTVNTSSVNVYVNHPPAPTHLRTKQYSPFSWGLGVGLGLVAALVIVLACGGFFSGLTSGKAARAPQTETVWIPAYVNSDGDFVPGHYKRIAVEK